MKIRTYYLLGCLARESPMAPIIAQHKQMPSLTAPSKGKENATLDGQNWCILIPGIFE
jgi:hypothetical protein